MRVIFTFRVATLLLNLALSLPHSAFALRTLQPDQDPKIVQRITAGLEETFQKEVQLGYRMHMMPTSIFAQQIESFYRVTDGSITLILRNTRNGTEITPRKNLDILSLGIDSTDVLTITALGKLPPSVLKVAVDTVESLLIDLGGAGKEFQSHWNYVIPPWLLNYRSRRRLKLLGEALASQGSRSSPPSSDVIGATYFQPTSGQIESWLIGMRYVIQEIALGSIDRPIEKVLADLIADHPDMPLLQFADTAVCYLVTGDWSPGEPIPFEATALLRLVFEELDKRYTGRSRKADLETENVLAAVKKRAQLASPQINVDGTVIRRMIERAKEIVHITPFLKQDPTIIDLLADEKEIEKPPSLPRTLGMKLTTDEVVGVTAIEEKETMVSSDQYKRIEMDKSDFVEEQQAAPIAGHCFGCTFMIGIIRL